MWCNTEFILIFYCFYYFYLKIIFDIERLCVRKIDQKKYNEMFDVKSIWLIGADNLLGEKCEIKI